MGKKGNKLIYYLALIGFFGIFSTTISKNPVLSLYTQALGASEVVIGLIAAISPLAGILFSFPIGMLSDKIGKKKLLVASSLVFVISPLFYLFINSAVWLIPIRFFHGIATAILGPVVAAMIVSIYEKDKGEKLGWYSSSTLIGRTIAPLIGGAIISYFIAYGLWSYKFVYLAAFIFAIPTLILVLFLKYESNGKTKILELKDFSSNFKYMFNEKKILSTALVQLATYFAFGAFETYLPIFLSDKGIPAYQIGFIFSLQIFSIALSQPVFGKIADRIDKRIQIVLGILTLGIAIGIVALFSSIISVILLGILFGLGLSFSTVATSSYVAEIADKDKLGTSLGGLSSIMDLGHSSGPFITGIIISSLSFFWGFFASLVLAVISAIVFYAINRRKN